MALMYVSDPQFKKEDLSSKPTDNYITILNRGEYVGMQPRFSKDFSRLCYVSSDSKFLSHSSNYQLKYLDWPVTQESKPVTVLDYVNEYPEDTATYSGLYGYNMTYTPCKFLGDSNRFYLIMSEFKSQNRLYIADLENPGSVRWINFLDKSVEDQRVG
mgnify:CR=1 FL=1